MDHQAFAQLLGNYGEFFGAIAVVVTLIYLADQLRQNTNALRSASYEHWNDMSNSYYDFYALYANEISEIEQYDNVDQLEPNQLKILMALASRAVLQAETAYLLHRARTLDNDVFEARIRAFEAFLSRVPLARDIWRARKRNSPTDFVEYLESRIPELRAGNLVA